MRIAIAMLLSLVAVPTIAAPLELKPGEHICLIGNTLAERMQHHGWLETLLHARFPKHELVVRNLGYSGDELALRLRSQGFGSPDEHLTRNEADVIFAFFGYNESFAGEAGLPKFKQELQALVRHMRGQKYNGRSAPRIVLFSPIAHQNLRDPNLPDGKANNGRLKLYSAAMEDVARAEGIVFVDLFARSMRHFETAPADWRLTINGVHLAEMGDRNLSALIEGSLLGDAPDVPPLLHHDQAYLAKLRAAVLDKNFYWYHRHRTTDGYSTYGGRADLRFERGQTNRDVMNRELQVLDVLTANRDRRIWAVAQGGNPRVDDSNAPPLLEVITNKPGPLPGGKHVFLSGAESITKMTIGKGLKVGLFASEEKFPELVNPVQMAFDTKGRLWVAAWPTYPHWTPREEMNDKLLILEDTDGDGQADVGKTFAGDLHNPTGFEFYRGGVIVAMAPYLLYLKDTDGDDKADVRERILGGLDTADTHHTANSFTFDPGGALYFQEGTFHHSQVETPHGPPARCANGGVFRYEPLAHKFDVYVSYGFANPHGHAFDRWGQDIVVDGTGSNPFHAALFSGRVEFPRKHPHPPQVYNQRMRPCPAIEFLSSSHFPDDMQGNLLVGNVIGLQGIMRYRIDERASSFAGTELESIVSSSDANFRPADLETGPDGALYFTDWHNPIIGHMQHNLRDPSRDRTHGRVYRVTYEGRPLVKPVAIAGQPIEKLLALLKDPQNRVRYRAKIELSARDRDEVIAATEKWLSALAPSEPEHEHHVLEALWVYQWHNVVNIPLLERVFNSPDFRARAAATRVLCYWRDRVPDAIARFRRLAADAHPRVRLEAVRAASFFELPEAVEVPLIADEHPSDPYLAFVRTETMKTLEPYWKEALAAGRSIPVASEAGAKFLLRGLSNEQLLKSERSRAVCLELLYRPGLRDEDRRVALAALAKLERRGELDVLLDTIRKLDGKGEDRDETVVFDLVRLLAGRRGPELQAARIELEKLATSAKQPVIRQVAYVALVSVDGGVDKVWALAQRSVPTLVDLLTAVPLIPDASLRASLYPKIEPLLTALPAHLATNPAGRGTYGRYVRVELPGRGTLTLAEVEVYSGGRNVARQGKASQTNTSNGGGAERAIDGKTSGLFSMESQTHTRENTEGPWWEVDLGDEFPIDSITIHNRTESNLGKRLDGYTLRVLDASKNVVFEQRKQPAPERKAEHALSGGGPETLVRRAAMGALVSVRGQEARSFALLSRFVRDDLERLAAIRALQKIPRTAWPADEAVPLLSVLVEHVQKIPVAERTSPAALDALEFADSLAALLPAADAKKMRAQLSELGVRVIRIGTVLERMAYDKEAIAVKAGKPVEILFENSDMMPHNLVITQPGAMAEIGQMAEATATDPSAQQRQFVPASKKILLSSRLLQPRDSQKLSFVAPTQPGVYPYVCTYPGHWRRMYGALFVVEDLDQYLAGPEAYLAANPLPIKDDLLKDRRTRTEWKFEDLAAALDQYGHGRSYGNGKQMFQVATCIACHKLDGTGNEFGPDLVKLDDKFKPVDILREMLDPSAKINEKYQTEIFRTDSGETITGLVIKETPEKLTIIENPLAKTQPIELAKSEIESRRHSPTSLMPKGLLDKLTRDEILDLVAYITARGNRDHELFQGGGHEHHEH